MRAYDLTCVRILFNSLVCDSLMFHTPFFLSRLLSIYTSANLHLVRPPNWIDGNGGTPPLFPL